MEIESGESLKQTQGTLPSEKIQYLANSIDMENPISILDFGKKITDRLGNINIKITESMKYNSTDISNVNNLLAALDSKIKDIRSSAMGGSLRIDTESYIRQVKLDTLKYKKNIGTLITKTVGLQKELDRSLSELSDTVDAGNYIARYMNEEILPSLESNKEIDSMLLSGMIQDAKDNLDLLTQRISDLVAVQTIHLSTKLQLRTENKTLTMMATRLDNLIMTIIPGLEQSLKQQVQSESVKDQILRANGGMYSETNPYGSSGNYDFDSNKGSRTSSNGLLWSSQSNSKPTKLW